MLSLSIAESGEANLEVFKVLNALPTKLPLQRRATLRVSWLSSITAQRTCQLPLSGISKEPIESGLLRAGG